MLKTLSFLLWPTSLLCFVESLVIPSRVWRGKYMPLTCHKLLGRTQLDPQAFQAKASGQVSQRPTHRVSSDMASPVRKLAAFPKPQIRRLAMACPSRLKLSPKPSVKAHGVVRRWPSLACVSLLSSQHSASDRHWMGLKSTRGSGSE